HGRQIARRDAPRRAAILATTAVEMVEARIAKQYARDLLAKVTVAAAIATHVEHHDWRGAQLRLLFAHLGDHSRRAIVQTLQRDPHAAAKRTHAIPRRAAIERRCDQGGQLSA